MRLINIGLNIVCLLSTFATSCAKRNIDERIPRDLDETSLNKYIVNLGSDNPIIRDRAYLVLSEQGQLTSRKTIKEATADPNPDIRMMSEVLLYEKDNFIRKSWIEHTHIIVTTDVNENTLRDFVEFLSALTHQSILIDLDVDGTLNCKASVKNMRLSELIRTVLEPHGLICAVKEGRVTVMKYKHVEK